MSIRENPTVIGIHHAPSVVTLYTFPYGVRAATRGHLPDHILKLGTYARAAAKAGIFAQQCHTGTLCAISHDVDD
jgi:hypothetical protein